MNLYLSNQKRDRDLDIYLEKLCVSQEEFEQINHADKKLLLIGGGLSTSQLLFSIKTKMKIVNIDFHPSESVQSNRIVSIKEDFIKSSMFVNEFDEIWALYSLPLYSPTKESIHVFFAKTIIAARPEGKIRFYPLEFDKNNKMSTRDADYDISLLECTETVLTCLKLYEQDGIKTNRMPMQFKDNRIEESVTIVLNCSELHKAQINDQMKEQLILYSTEKTSYTTNIII